MLASFSQELEIAYYKTMSRFVQYRRKVLKNNVGSIKGKILENPFFAKGVIQ